MPDPDQEKLDELTEQIDGARRQAQEHGTLPDPNERTFIDPDGDGEITGGAETEDTGTDTDNEGDPVYETDDDPEIAPG